MSRPIAPRLCSKRPSVSSAKSKRRALPPPFVHIRVLTMQKLLTYTRQIPTLDFADFLAQASAQSFFRYTGSLTTPPCSEGVEWYIASTPIPLSAATYLSLKATTKTNNRFSQNTPLQPNILSIAAAPAGSLGEFVEGGNEIVGATVQEVAIAEATPQTEAGSEQGSFAQATGRFNPLVAVGKRRLAKDH